MNELNMKYTNNIANVSAGVCERSPIQFILRYKSFGKKLGIFIFESRIITIEIMT